MDFTNPTVIFNAIIVVLILGVFYFLLRRSWTADPDAEMDIFEYGQLILQAEQTARIIVRGVQEAWRTGELDDDEREEDAIDQLADLYPQLDEVMLRRIVKSAVYLLRKSAGKQVDRVMEQIPEGHSFQPGQPGDSLLELTEDGGIRLSGTVSGTTISAHTEGDSR